LQISYLKSVDSTQKYLKEKIKSKELQAPHAVVAEIQSSGVGSRDNTWIGYEGNLFLSFAFNLDALPKDLKLESASIYFAYILKETLEKENSNVWLKWPNDFYIGDEKIGGMITNVVSDVLICGVGLNLVESPTNFNTLDIDISKESLLNKYLKNIEKFLSWKQIFRKYKLEFYRNQNFFTHNNNDKISLSDAQLLDDGSIYVKGERIYSLR
jgi:BirA family biotin operon repressor/biotin-[acetyl-CoA-carboxylase] ligase